jgi:hypothetical protein
MQVIVDKETYTKLQMQTPPQPVQPGYPLARQKQLRQLVTLPSTRTIDVPAVTKTMTKKK